MRNQTGRLSLPCSCGEVVLVNPNTRQTNAASKDGVLLDGVHHRWSAPCFFPSDGSAGHSPTVSNGALARFFHETYEKLAPSYGYATRKASAVPWGDVPYANRLLMMDVAWRALCWLEDQGVQLTKALKFDDGPENVKRTALGSGESSNRQPEYPDLTTPTGPECDPTPDVGTDALMEKVFGPHKRFDDESDETGAPFSYCPECDEDWPCTHEQLRAALSCPSAGYDRDTLRQVIAKATYHEANGGLLGFQFQGWKPEERYEFADRTIERYESAVSQETST